MTGSGTRLDRRLTIGAKRNIGCEMARGPVIAHWDDDDWVADWRLRYQVDALLELQVDIVGLQTLLYLDPLPIEPGSTGTRRRTATGCTTTFCYRREIWQAQHFPNSNHGLDTGFLRSGRRKRLGVLADHRFYVGLIHGTNTSPKFTVGANWRRKTPTSVIALLGDDAASYEAAVGGPTPCARPSDRCGGHDG